MGFTVCYLVSYQIRLVRQRKVASPSSRRAVATGRSYLRSGGRYRLV